MKMNTEHNEALFSDISKKVILLFFQYLLSLNQILYSL